MGGRPLLDLLESARPPAPRRLALTIARQVHRVWCAREEKRCRARERKTAKPVTRRKIPIPVVRLGPLALCDRLEFLACVTQFDYDLEDLEFLEYARQRGVLPAIAIGSRPWTFICQHSLSEWAYSHDSPPDHSTSHQEPLDPLALKQTEFGWSVICDARARLQDCWEVFRTNSSRIRWLSTLRVEIGDIVVLQRPPWGTKGLSAETSFEVVLPETLAPWRRFLILDYALQWASDIAADRDVSIWFQHAEGVEYSLLATFRSARGISR